MLPFKNKNTSNACLLAPQHSASSRTSVVRVCSDDANIVGFLFVLLPTSSSFLDHRKSHPVPGALHGERHNSSSSDDGVDKRTGHHRGGEERNPRIGG